MPRLKSERSYWLGLSAAYGVALALLTMTDLPWPGSLPIFAALVVFIVVQGLLYGQFDKAVLYEVDPRKGTAGALLTFFPLGTYLIRGSEIALWAGPLYGLIASAGSYAILKKYGYFYRPAVPATELGSTK
ncbi:hypothetical protein [Paenarthrobacter sp. NPDC018779]|uniref:hypothetical protein n=1 Tax=Paenarthrobacter sp. NPDC018779 TaxID=3364375 RepID=UPI0037C7358C